MSTYIRTWTVLVRVNTGPPTWWKPDFKIERDKITIIRFGWLQMCVQIGIGTKRALEAEMESSLLPADERAEIRALQDRFNDALRVEDKVRRTRLGVEIVKDVDRFMRPTADRGFEDVSAQARAMAEDIKMQVGIHIFDIDLKTAEKMRESWSKR
jgi:hypothetical protein